jgi:hypothetical protein
VQITRLPMFPRYVGKRLDEIAKAEGISKGAVSAYARHPNDGENGPNEPSGLPRKLKEFAVIPGAFKTKTEDSPPVNIAKPVWSNWNRRS